MQLLAPRFRPEEEVNDRGGRGELSPAARAKILFAAAVGPLIAGYAAIAALFALITAIASVATFSIAGVLHAAGPGWLAAYQVPVTIGGRPLGVLPLLVTIGMCLLVARSASHAADRLGYREPGQAVNVVAPMTAAHAMLSAVVALSSVGGGVTVEPLAGFLVPGSLAALSATVGVAKPCGIVAGLRAYLDPVAIRGLRAGALGMAGLFACGALVFTVSLMSSARTVGELFDSNAAGFGSGAGMLLLSLGYLPNAVIGTLAFTAGPGFSLGQVSIGVFTFAGGPVPGVPILAGIPEHPARWWGLLMVLPAAVGALVGWSLRRSDDRPLARLRTVGIAGALVGFGCVLLGTLAGGRLASGPFDPVSIPAGLLSVAGFGWIVLPGGLVAWFAGPRRDEEPAEIVRETHPAEEDDEADAPDGENTDADEDSENEADSAAEESPPTSSEPKEPS
jgi:Family of unknown function (DUF6350)